VHYFTTPLEKWKYNQYTTDSDEEEEDGEVAGEIDHSVPGPAARQAYTIRHFS